MNELIEMAYKKYLEEYGEAEELQLNRNIMEKIDNEVELLETLVGRETIQTSLDEIVSGLDDIQKAGFFAGFAFSHKILTAGEVNFFAA